MDRIYIPKPVSTRADYASRTEPLHKYRNTQWHEPHDQADHDRRLHSGMRIFDVVAFL